MTRDLPYDWPYNCVFEKSAFCTRNFLFAEKTVDFEDTAAFQNRAHTESCFAIVNSEHNWS